MQATGKNKGKKIKTTYERALDWGMGKRPCIPHQSQGSLFRYYLEASQLLQLLAKANVMYGKDIDTTSHKTLQELGRLHEQIESTFLYFESEFLEDETELAKSITA